MTRLDVALVVVDRHQSVGGSAEEGADQLLNAISEFQIIKVNKQAYLYSQ